MGVSGAELEALRGAAPGLPARPVTPAVMLGGGTVIYHDRKQRDKEAWANSKKRHEERRRKTLEGEKLTIFKNPFASIRLQGKKVKMHAHNGRFQSDRDSASLVPCPAEPPTLIDRFDGRALIDPIPPGGWTGNGDGEDWGESTARVGGQMPPSRKERAEESFLSFERYRDLMRSMRLRKSERLVVAQVQDVFEQHLEDERAEQARRQEEGCNAPNLLQVGKAPMYVSSSESENEEGDGDVGEGDGAGVVRKEKLPDDKVDELAREHGIFMYWTIRAVEERERELKQEERERQIARIPQDLGPNGKPLPRWERQKLRRQRQNERMQSLLDDSLSHLNIVRSFSRRSRSRSRSPGPRGAARARSRSRSPSVGRDAKSGKAQMITSFSLDGGGDADGSGGVGGACGGRGRGAEEEALTFEDYEDKELIRAFFPEVFDKRDEARRARPEEMGREATPERERERSRERERAHEAREARDPVRPGGAVGGATAASGRAAPGTAGGKGAASGAGGEKKKLTPAEKLKLKMQRQLQSKSAQDQAEKDRREDKEAREKRLMHTSIVTLERKYCSRQDQSAGEGAFRDRRSRSRSRSRGGRSRSLSRGGRSRSRSHSRGRRRSGSRSRGRKSRSRSRSRSRGRSRSRDRYRRY